MLTAGDESSLQGIFVATGSPASVAGPWKLIGDEAKLPNSGSALHASAPATASASRPGTTRTSRSTRPTRTTSTPASKRCSSRPTAAARWVTASPYWNYGSPCDTTRHLPEHDASRPARDDDHRRQDRDRQRRRRLQPAAVRRAAVRRLDRPQRTLRTLQYYDARAGQLGRRAAASASGAACRTTAPRSLAPVPADGRAGRRRRVRRDRRPEQRATTWSASTPTGRCTRRPTAATRSPTTSARPARRRRSPAAGRPAVRTAIPTPGSSPRSSRTSTNANVWVTGGEYVWVTHGRLEHELHDHARARGQNVFDTGAGNAVTALTSADGGAIIYAAWVGGGGNPGPAFSARHRDQLRRHLAPGQHGRPARPLHRRDHRRPAQPGARVRRLQRLLAALDPRRRRRPRVRDRRTAAQPGPTSPETCRTSRPTRSFRSTASSRWPPTSGRTPPRPSRAPGPVVPARHRPPERVAERHHDRPRGLPVRGHARSGGVADPLRQPWREALESYLRRNPSSSPASITSARGGGPRCSRQRRSYTGGHEPWPSAQRHAERAGPSAVSDDTSRARA